MKYKAIVCLSLLLIGSGLTSAFAKDPPASAEQLRAEVESALKAKDASALIGLFNWQGVSDNFKTMMGKMAADMTNHEWTAVKLAPLPDDFQATNVVNGIRYRPSVAVTGWIVVEFTPKETPRSFPMAKAAMPTICPAMWRKRFRGRSPSQKP
jgi:hypothetical protein